jgi:hypothetical protein
VRPAAGRRPGCCVTGVAARGAVALAAADPAAADSTTSVTGTSMTFSTSAPTATGTAVTDGPYKEPSTTTPANGMAGAPTASAVSAGTPAGRRNANRTIRNVTT